MLLSIAERRVHYDLVGPADGSVACFLHSLMLDTGMWAEQVQPLLASGHRVLRIDTRGHGGSDASPGDYTLPQLADDAVAVIDALGIDSVDLVGLSLGGMIAQALAIAYPARVRSLMLCDTLAATLPASREILAQRIESVRAANGVEHLADQTMGRMLTEAFAARHPARWRTLRATIVGTTALGYIGCGHATLNFDFTTALAALAMPVLVVYGAEDPLTPPAENRRIADLVPNGRHQEIAAARHMPNVERPDMFNRLLIEWLERNG